MHCRARSTLLQWFPYQSKFRFQQSASIGNLSCEVSGKVVSKCDTFAGECTYIGEGDFTRSLEDASFIGIKRTIGCRHGVVLGHCPNVSQDEIGLDEWFSIEITVSRPCDGSRYTRALTSMSMFGVAGASGSLSACSPVTLMVVSPNHVMFATSPRMAVIA